MSHSKKVQPVLLGRQTLDLQLSLSSCSSSGKWKRWLAGGTLPSSVLTSSGLCTSSSSSASFTSPLSHTPVFPLVTLSSNLSQSFSHTALHLFLSAPHRPQVTPKDFVCSEVFSGDFCTCLLIWCCEAKNRIVVSQCAGTFLSNVWILMADSDYEHFLWAVCV